MAKLILDATPQRRSMIQPLICYLKRRIPEGRRKILVEIGSFCGMSTMEFAGIFEKVYAVDAWDVAAYPKNDRDIVRKKGQAHLSDAEMTFDHHMKNFPNVTKIKMRSGQAFKQWEELIGEKPDAVYIDALHSYEGCKADIETWGSIARRLVMGHDYHKSWPGVMKAVNEAFTRPDVTFKDASWVHDIEMRLQPHPPMDAAEFAQKLHIFAHVAEDEFSTHYTFDRDTGTWAVHVKEVADGHDVFGGRGQTVEDANRVCWNDILLGHRDYGYKLAPIFVDESEELRRAVE